jgi:crotonobetainyl-CoA:carnitine CoA-transferase CaiB-like acyl-CoA transferase
MSFSPLDGVRVLDFSTSMAGPFAAMILAQLGAEVIKIEPPQGDDSRHWPPARDDGSIVHCHMNAGKRGIVLDLRHEAAQEIALELAARADVLLQSMRPGVADRIGIGEHAVRQVNPNILYYNLNAFGSGPDGSALPGYDPLVQAFSGIMRMNGHEGTPPARCAPSVIDLGTGQWVAMGILAAMLAKHRGQRVHSMETALVDTAFSLAPYQATTALMTGQRPKRAGSGNPIAAPYQVYAARDGELMLAAPNQRLWERVVQVLDAEELLKDTRFRTVGDRSGNNAALDREITKRLADADVETWVARFREAGVPVTRVAGLEEAVRTSIAQERKTFQDSGGLPLVRLPWLVNGKTAPWLRRAPHLGEHTVDVLRELGRDDAEIAELVRSGAALAYADRPQR